LTKTAKERLHLLEKRNDEKILANINGQPVAAIERPARGDFAVEIPPFTEAKVTIFSKKPRERGSHHISYTNKHKIFLLLPQILCILNNF
jgi:hypothetical protein